MLIHHDVQKVDHRRGYVRRLLVGIQHRQSPALWKPQAPIRCASPSAAGGITGRTLCAAQPVGNAVVHRADGMNFAGREIVQLLLPHAADSTRSAEPERAAAIIFDMRNVVAQQPVFGCEMEESSIPQSVQASAKSADPKCPVRVLMKSPNLIVRKSIGYGEPHRLPVLPSPQTLPIRTGPQASILRLAERNHGVV